jgi:hypothetical protein
MRLLFGKQKSGLALVKPSSTSDRPMYWGIRRMEERNLQYGRGKDIFFFLFAPTLEHRAHFSVS